MEFRPRPEDEEMFSSFEPSPPPPHHHPFSGNGYFSFQAMRAGFVDRPRNSLEALEMELREERLREEIIARRVAQRRMIEEQSRREMEVAVAMGMGRGGGGPLCHTQLMLQPPEEVEFGERRRFGLRFGRRSMPEVPEDIDFGGRVVEFEDRSRFCPPLGRRHVGADGRVPREAREVEVGKKLASWSKKPEVKTTTVETIEPKLVGTKRKPVADISGTSGSKFSRPAQKVWSCALCQVSATSEEGLNEHLQGRKHLAKVAQLGSKKNFAVTALANSGTGSGSAPKPNVATKKKPSAKVTRKVSIKVNDKVHEVVEKGRFLWCWMCRVKCNDQSAMIAHLSGKRHLLEESKKPTAIGAGTPQNKEVVEDNKKERACEDKKECTEVAAQYAVSEIKKELTEEAEQCGFKKEAEQLGSASADMVVVKD